MERVYANLCPTCRDKLERLYFLRDEQSQYEGAASCQLCGWVGLLDRVSYVPARDSIRGGYRA